MQSVNRYLEELYSVKLNEAVNTKQDVQEFKDKLKKEIVKKFKGLIDPYEKDALEMDLEMALYWYANDYHSGQSDIWYSILSTSDYKPGRSEKELDGEENPQAEMFYDYIKSKYNKKINESMDDEVHTFDKPMDMFKQIVKESQAIYVKEKDGKIEGRYNPKPKKEWILVDGLSANKAVKLYNAATDEQKAKIDKLGLIRFLNALWK